MSFELRVAGFKSKKLGSTLRNGKSNQATLNLSKGFPRNLTGEGSRDRNLLISHAFFIIPVLFQPGKGGYP